MALFVAHTKKYLYASFSFSYWKYSCTLSIFSVVFTHEYVVLLTTQKSRWAEKQKKPKS